MARPWHGLVRFSVAADSGGWMSWGGLRLRLTSRNLHRADRSRPGETAASHRALMLCPEFRAV